jgi:2-keto-4-pentenoate hydratase/2-oxohepta-3-ene-1,7-dioic acid hydratase in catechol pathway
MRLRLRGEGDGHGVELGAVYTVGLNYADPGGGGDPRPPRPLIYGKASSSLVGDGATIAWDPAVTQAVDGECELGVVLGPAASVRGYTIVNDVTSRDPWLDGDQWLLGKSMPGFCPVGPDVVRADELDVEDLRLGMRINGIDVQDGRTSQMRYSIAQVIAYLGRHIDLVAGDLIATGTPVRAGPLADRHLVPGDVMTCWIEGIGELTTTVAPVSEARSSRGLETRA